MYNFDDSIINVINGRPFIIVDDERYSRSKVKLIKYSGPQEKKYRFLITLDNEYENYQIFILYAPLEQKYRFNSNGWR